MRRGERSGSSTLDFSGNVFYYLKAFRKYNTICIYGYYIIGVLKNVFFIHFYPIALFQQTFNSNFNVLLCFTAIGTDDRPLNYGKRDFPGWPVVNKSNLNFYLFTLYFIITIQYTHLKIIKLNEKKSLNMEQKKTRILYYINEYFDYLRNSLSQKRFMTTIGQVLKKNYHPNYTIPLII